MDPDPHKMSRIPDHCQKHFPPNSLTRYRRFELIYYGLYFLCSPATRCRRGSSWCARLDCRCAPSFGRHQCVCVFKDDIIFVRHVTGTGSGLLEEIPRSGIQISASTKRATIGVRAPYATRRKLRYEANQV